MKQNVRQVIADQRTGLRPLSGEAVLSATFCDGNLQLENGCILADSSINYRTADGREFAEVLELSDGADGVDGLLIGFVEVFPEARTDEKLNI